MTEQERNEYLKAYYDNEADANRQMSLANALCSAFMLIIWILYLTGVFPVASTMIITNIVFPISILVLLTPFLYAYPLKNKGYIRKSNYKYFVIFSFIMVIAAVNILIPKHGILAWALIIVMTNHYYNPKLGKITFFAVLGVMLLCLYAGMFLGEYDPNLIGNGIIQDGKIVYNTGVQARYDLLHEQLMAGENRYLKVFLFYYIPRAAILTLIFIVSNALNKRTYNLLVQGIKTNSAQEKTRTELEVAKEIQLATLPNELLVNKDIEIQAELRAAKAVGGDFYDYFVLDENHVAILIGDVSGKGIPAAMFMMKTITCFKNQVSIEKTPAEIMRTVNKTLFAGNDSGMFVTCFLAIIDTKTGDMQFANAGHNPPIIGKGQHFRNLPCKTGFVLGGFEQAFVTDETAKLENGEAIFLYTDGITEARNEKGEFFGEKRLLDTMNEKQYSCLVELIHTVKDHIAEFAGNAEQSDDMTYIALRYHGDECLFEEKTYPAQIKKIPEMLQFLKDFTIKQSLHPSFANQLAVVGDELFSNIIKYGYPGTEGDIFLRLLYNVTKKEFVLTIIDKGVPFNPFEVNNKPVEGEAANIQEGGLGILIVKTMMDECAYDRVYGKNIIILKKRF